MKKTNFIVLLSLLILVPSMVLGDPPQEPQVPIYCPEGRPCVGPPTGKGPPGTLPSDGVYPISAAAFRVEQGYVYMSDTAYICVYGPSYRAYAPITLPFKSIITGFEARVKNHIGSSGNIVVDLADGHTVNGILDPLDTVDTVGIPLGDDGIILNSGLMAYQYDPTNLYKPLYVRVTFSEPCSLQKLYWAKVYYVLPK